MKTLKLLSIIFFLEGISRIKQKQLLNKVKVEVEVEVEWNKYPHTNHFIGIVLDP